MSWEDHMTAPEKPDKMFDRMQVSQFWERETYKMKNQIHKTAKQMVLKNVYKTYYDLRNDTSYRKPDIAMRAIVETSETLKKVETLHEHGLHPQLIFFGKELFDN